MKGREGRERITNVPRRPARRGTFVVRHRLRIGGLVSGACLLAGLAVLTLTVLSTPWWIVDMFRPVQGVGGLLIALFALLIVLGLPAVVALPAGIRPGNAALRRRVLAMDGEGVWIYESALWWSAPYVVPWRDAGLIRASTRDHTDVDAAETGPTPTLVPWDYLDFGDPPRAGVHLRWLTATAEEIVEQARLRRPDLVFLDRRTPPPAGLGGWVLRRRRSGRRPPFLR
ncbi:hypothetical protein ALI22I_09255 [Saccharothrix sp. ALI-22-I]|uniref:hypothetical protein n=1 Tax=Saccharothrix sp. ALI-22-I TaxID=1933778 RepID=UPI00097C9899|nr:hypothetical protein [Saccharothrix sp. ALI-22-I]ONI91250.1 hypothetical protein ALI22I_09255 [Saccharothrix sp. ALI-22-I]